MKEKSRLYKNQTRFGFLLLFTIALLLPNATIAQEGKVNFSGDWALNETKSNLGDRGSRGASRSLTIKHSGINMTTERISTGRNGEEIKNVEKLTLDGKKCENSTNNRTRISTANWSDDGTTLTINSVRIFTRQGETMELKSKEGWILSSGGKVLTIKSTNSSPRGDVSTTLVYEKK